MNTWTQSAALKSGLPIYRKPALTSIDHDSQLVRVSYHEAIKIADDYIELGTGNYEIQNADPDTSTGQMTAAAEQVIASELAKELPGT